MKHYDFIEVEQVEENSTENTDKVRGENNEENNGEDYGEDNRGFLGRTVRGVKRVFSFE